MVQVNCVLADGVEVPFGGIKNSGTRRELGRLGADELVEQKDDPHRLMPRGDPSPLLSISASRRD